MATRSFELRSSLPCEYNFAFGDYAVFFRDSDGIKLELLHRPSTLDVG